MVACINFPQQSEYGAGGGGRILCDCDNWHRYNIVQSRGIATEHGCPFLVGPVIDSPPLRKRKDNFNLFSSTSSGKILKMVKM